jgi:hypothetical protein
MVHVICMDSLDHYQESATRNHLLGLQQLPVARLATL